MKTPFLVAAGLTVLGWIVLFALNVGNVPEMFSVALESLKPESMRTPGVVSAHEEVLAAKSAWSALSVAVASGLSLAVGFAWIPLLRRVWAWAESAPQVREVFHFKNVRWVSDTPTEGFVSLAAVAMLGVWVLLPAFHMVLGRLLFPVPLHLVEGHPGHVLMCLPLLVGYVLLWRGRSDSAASSGGADGAAESTR